MPTPVTYVASGGLPVTIATNGLPVTQVAQGGAAVTVVSSGGMPIAPVSVTGLPLLAEATAYLGGIAPYNYWDFTQNRALYASADIGAVTNTPGWTVSGGSLVMDSTGLTVTNQLITAAANISGDYTVWAEVYRGTDTGAAEFYFQPYFDASNRVNILIGAIDVAGVITRTAGATVANPSLVSAPAGATYKIAGRIKTNDFNTAVNGTLGTQDTAGALPTAPATFQFGSNNGASFAGSGNLIRRVAIFNSALSDANLQTATT